jgi:hypothetical protein
VSEHDPAVETVVRTLMMSRDARGLSVGYTDVVRQSVAAGVKLGEEREREECATLAEWYECKVPRPSHSDIVEGVAAAIRARGEGKGGR